MNIKKSPLYVLIILSHIHIIIREDSLITSELKSCSRTSRIRSFIISANILILLDPLSPGWLTYMNSP